MKKTFACLLFCAMLSLTTTAQVFDFYNSIYYLSPDSGTGNGTALTSSGINLSGFNYTTASASHPLFKSGIYYPVQACGGQNIWVRIQHIAADPNGTGNGNSISKTTGSPFEPAGSTDRIGGGHGFLYDIKIFRDSVLYGTRSDTLNGFYETSIIVESLETLYNQNELYEWLSFEIKNTGSTGWQLLSTDFTGINPHSHPGFSDTLAYATTATITEPPVGFSDVFPAGSENIYAVDLNTSEFEHSEFRISAGNVSHFQYGYEFLDNRGYQGMSMQFGVPPTVLNFTTDPLCAESSDGSISLQVSGSAPFTYLWSNGNTTDELTNINKGSYEVTITDRNGCPVQLSLDLFAPDTLDAEINYNLGVDTTVSLQALPFGGTPPYTFEWSTADTTMDIILDKTEGGLFSVTITDVNGCFKEKSIIVEPVGIDEVNRNRNDIRLLPNPASAFIDFAVRHNSNGNIIITDVCGRQLETITLTTGQELYRLDLGNFNTGVYFYHFTSGNSQTQGGKFVVDK